MLIPVQIAVLLLVAAAAIALQVYLSGRRAWWPGVVLPVLWFAYTAFAVVAAAAGYAQAYGEPLPLTLGLVCSALLGMLQANNPTFVLLAVYFFCRSHRRRQKLLDRMQVQDL